MKKASALLLAAIAVAGCGIAASANTATIKAQVDDSVNDGYTPTQLKNGDFETYPDKGEISATGGADWQTTETQKNNTMGHNGYFEWIDHTFVASGQTELRYRQNYAVSTSNGNFIEMNSVNASVLYQDLDTNPGDVILWKLSHATRNTSGAPDYQEMEVHIGENDGNNSPSGTNPNIDKNLATYRYDGVVNSGDTEYGYLAGGVSDLANLKLTKKSDWANDTDPWKVAKAVYRIPADQDSTRFAFTSVTPGSTGNLLDDIVFETLLGNLKIDTTLSDGIKVTGYWAPIEENENININYTIASTDGQDIEIQGVVDMSALRTSNSSGFSIMIPFGDMEDGEYLLEVNHANYKDAKATKEFSVRNTPKTLRKIEEQKKAEEEKEKERLLAAQIDENPNTYDGILIWGVVLALSTAGILGVLYYKKKQNR